MLCCATGLNAGSAAPDGSRRNGVSMRGVENNIWMRLIRPCASTKPGSMSTAHPLEYTFAAPMVSGVVPDPKVGSGVPEDVMRQSVALWKHELKITCVTIRRTTAVSVAVGTKRFVDPSPVANVTRPEPPPYDVSRRPSAVKRVSVGAEY